MLSIRILQRLDSLGVVELHLLMLRHKRIDASAVIRIEHIPNDPQSKWVVEWCLLHLSTDRFNRLAELLKRPMCAHRAICILKRPGDLLRLGF